MPRHGPRSPPPSSRSPPSRAAAPPPPAPALDLLLLHGLADEVVPAEWVLRNEQRLIELAPPDGSVTVRRRGIPGLAHEVTPEEIAVLVAWIDERLRSLGFGV